LAMSEELARKFHEAYERLAPSFGYETRKETRDFDPTSANGMLMIAVCGELAGELAGDLEAENKRTWEHRANSLARSYAPNIYSCKKCGNPCVSGYCCGYCGSNSPSSTVEEDEQEARIIARLKHLRRDELDLGDE